MRSLARQERVTRVEEFFNVRDNKINCAGTRAFKSQTIAEFVFPRPETQRFVSVCDFSPLPHGGWWPRLVRVDPKKTNDI